jgi:hypothetical protein
VVLLQSTSGVSAQLSSTCRAYADAFAVAPEPMQVGEHVVDQKKLYTGLFIIGTSSSSPWVWSRTYRCLLSRRYSAAVVRRPAVYFLLARWLVVGVDHGTRESHGTGIGEVSLSVLQKALQDTRYSFTSFACSEYGNVETV